MNVRVEGHGRILTASQDSKDAVCKQTKRQSLKVKYKDKCEARNLYQLVILIHLLFIFELII